MFGQFDNSPTFFELRSKLYQEVASWEDKPFDEIFFEFSDPSFGWIDISIYVNGKKMHTFSISQVFPPFDDIKKWLEDIVDSQKPYTGLFFDTETQDIVFHYERLQVAESGCRRKFVDQDPDKDEWEKFNTPDYGLFYIYDSSLDELPVVCHCESKKLISALYNGIMFYVSREVGESFFKEAWYYNEGGTIWTLYNSIKSPLIEWHLDPKNEYRLHHQKFKKTPKIKETVHMWAEWGDALFWSQQAGCCGNADAFIVDTKNTEIDLSDLPELREWYNHFDSQIPEAEWPDEDYEQWYQKGWELAKKVRERMPPNVDLFYEWKYYSVDDNEFGQKSISILVPDNRLAIGNKND